MVDEFPTFEELPEVPVRGEPVDFNAAVITWWQAEKAQSRRMVLMGEAWNAALPVLNAIESTFDGLWEAVSSVSTTSMAPATGEKSLTVEAGKGFLAGMPIRVFAVSSPASVWMVGTVTSYNSGTGALVVNVTRVGGAGTIASWGVIAISSSIEIATSAEVSAGTATGKAVDPAGLTAALGGLPALRPALVLPFSYMDSLPGVVAFSRSSSGWRMNAAGEIVEALTNDPRMSFDANGIPIGLLIEGASTRLNLVAAAPTAAENVAVTAQAYTVSFFGTGSVVLSGAHAATVTGTGALPARVSYTFTPTAGTLTLTPSGTVQHLQVEAGTVPTSPILREGSQVARAPDMATVDVSGIEWNENEGTIFCEGYAPAVLSATTRFLFQADASGNASHRVYATMANNAVFAAVIASNTSQALLSLGTVNAGDRLRMAISFKANAFRGVLNGGAVVEDLSGVLPVGMSVLRIGNNHAGNQPWQSGIRHVAYFPRALTADQIQAMTS